MTLDKKWVFAFSEGDGKNKKLLGGKGANLCEMTQMGLNVPPGFVISTDACLEYLNSDDNELAPGLWSRSACRCRRWRRRPEKDLVIETTHS